ncbi:MAG: ABC transporter ATP-binding protein [Synergistaceae bacterium]|jgi:branched-chain amino acid transport system ATP-binding protein|nr:ABC transporter ATP-binding protein [Synergistaceae bacterium]
MPLLEIRGLTMKFGSLAANRDVSFDVEEGQIVGLIGPNGSGKTTLFNCVSGAYRPTAGRVTFDGTDITGMPMYKIARMGLTRTFQIVRPLSEMTVLENVMVGAYLHCADRARAIETADLCIKLCYLEEWRDRPSGAMTIGNKKRLEVARAMATSPRLILLDESAAGLTSTEVNDMVSLIVKLRDEGKTILMVEHIMEAVMPISDKVVVLSGGAKIAEGSPGEISRNEEVIRAYLGEKFSRRLAEANARRENRDE